LKGFILAAVVVLLAAGVACAQTLTYVDAEAGRVESLPFEFHGGFGYISLIELARVLDGELREEGPARQFILEFDSHLMVLFVDSPFIRLDGRTGRLPVSLRVVDGMPMVPLAVFGTISTRFPGKWEWDEGRLALARKNGKAEIVAMSLEEDAGQTQLTVASTGGCSFETVSRLRQDFVILFRDMFFHPAKVPVPEPAGSIREIDLFMEESGVGISLRLAEGTLGYCVELSRAADTLRVVFPCDTTSFLEGKCVGFDSPPEVPSVAPVVVLDPGHGGDDVGCPGVYGLPEKSIALAVAGMIRSDLERRGTVTPVLTRESDRPVSAPERVSVANAAQASLFISIHCDCWPSERPTGVRIYYPEAGSNAGGSRGGVPPGRGGTRSGSTTTFRRWGSSGVEPAVGGAEFARLLQASLEKSGIKATRYGAGRLYCLEGLEVPAVILSLGFLSNRKEGSILSESFYQRLISRAVASAVREYLIRKGARSG